MWPLSYLLVSVLSAFPGFEYQYDVVLASRANMLY